MRTLPLARASRMGLPIALVLALACAEDPVEAPNAGLLTDYATGVDASFGVQAFALGPTLAITSPSNLSTFTIQPNGSTDISVKFTVQGFTLGKVNCYLNGQLAGVATADPQDNTKALPFVFKSVKKGLHTLGCLLATDNGQEQSNPEARAVVKVKVVPTCLFNNECDDGLACTQNSCVDGKCKFEPTLNCCGSTFDCDPGNVCLEPNTLKSKCTACQKDAECNDDEVCTKDVCDLSGQAGVCKYSKTSPECCSKQGVGQCDDGKSCTADSCDLATGTCKHVKPEGTCCSDAECSSDDICKVGNCVDNECRFGKDKFKPECCHDAGDCNDKYYCNVDKCDKAMPGGWKQCTHTPDPTKTGPKGEPCCDPFNQTDECDDNNTCTWDICTNYLCENKVVAECCHPKTEAIDKICDDSNPCTLDVCEAQNVGDGSGKCLHKKIAGCCTDNPDCNDGLYCTTDSCNVAALSCVHKKNSDLCCDANKECQDGKTCTTGYCVNHGCYFGKDPDKPKDCCDTSADCNDGNACTIDSCNTDVNTCVFADNGVKGCCNKPSDCDDNDCTTTDFCDAANQCANKKTPYSCTQNIDCDDGKPCTKDICDASGGCGVCKNETDKACCELDGQCDDGKACSVDKCVNNKCDNSGSLKECCTNNLDAPQSCDDNNKCTIEYCLNNQCRHTVPKDGCCATTDDCNDGDKCTADKCELNGGKDGVCSFTKQPDCTSCTPLNATEACNDNNACTVEGCSSGACTHTPKKDCCLDQFDCDDNNPCTYDGCVFNQCWHSENAGSEKLCCKVETEKVDCADKNSECGVGKCKQQPSGKWACVAEAKPVCTFDIGYCQDYESGGSLPLMGWNPADIKGSAGSNWGVDVDAGLGPDQHARLTWTPIKVNYDTCLTSPVFQAAGANTITMQFDREFIKNVGTTNVRVLGSLDGENADWTKGVVIDTWTTSKSIAAETLDVKLPPILSGSNGLRLAFCVSGSSTFDLTKVGVDNFCIAKGSAPSFTACPPNHAAEMGFKKKIPVKAKDADLNDVISFSLVKAPSFVTLSTALYYWLDSSWNATLSVFATSKDDIGEHEVTIKVSDGKLYKLCTFKLTILYKGGVLVWKPTKVPTAHADAVTASIKGATGKITQVIDDISLYPDLKPFDAVFVLLGVYPDNHVLNDNEVDALKLYLSSSGKGRLYLEGGDTWAFDKGTSLHPFFKVTGVLDSAPNGVTGPLDGNSVYNDPNNPTKVFSWGYSQSFASNNLNDQIAGQTDVKRTGNLLRNGGVEKFWVHVGHDNKSAAYRTIGSSVLFSGVTSGEDQPLTLMKRIFNFFDNGFPDCKDDKGCNDGNACTIDKCQPGGECTHTNNCLCSSETQLKCKDAPKKLVTNSGAATQQVEQYPCDLSGTKYDGKEIAYGFKSADSRPITVKYTNVNNSQARVFVLKATAKGCDPTGCVATSAITNGSATVSFAAAAGVQYHLVMDVPGALNSAQFDMEVLCAEGEICDDGKDNNLNGVTDCYDLESCCGDKACPEVCDGLDNDCNGKVDEGCDDDGDLYCDVSMMVMKGAKCTNSNVPAEPFKKVKGDDCTDDDGTVNPGAKEICSNGKDDNCSGQEDEKDAVGCVKYYTDLDLDDYGTGQPWCLCAPSGSYKAKVGGDCQDGSKDINPGVPEQCASVNVDDNCNGSANDVNAVGCKNFYTDLDSDAWGTTPFKCICVAEGSFKAGKPGDCDDAVSKINPAAPEVCNNIDDNCDGTVDEGCDDDKDDYCDADFEYDPTKEPILVCPKGAGDTDDNDPEINPAGKEICDDKDNDSDGSTDEDCNKDGDTYCDAKIVTVGKPKVCTSGGDDCKDDDPKIHPGMKETCDTSYDDNCNDTANDLNATNCTPYFHDGDSDKWGTTSHQCLCVPKDSFKAVNPGDCKDGDPAINPGVQEICDDIDNDCDLVVDNGCDEDKDGYCNSLAKLVGSPKVCPSGGGDCDDTDGNVNPAKAEICGNGKDDNCNGSQNDQGAVGCANHWPDADDDAFGDNSVSPQCLCEAKGAIKATNNGDCNDKSADVNPLISEKCDDLDNDCDGKTDEGCDDDKDGYCDAIMETVGSPAICQKGSGDCNDEDPNVYKGKSSEICDGKDDDCNGVADNGCDKDQDGFCDGAKIVASPPPPVCAKGGGDCDDLNYDANPAATEVCNNSIDDNCNGSTNDEKAVGCSDFYFDGDGDKFGLNLSKCLCTGAGAYTAAKGGDCKDDNDKIHPDAVEVCDSADNNCDGAADEAGAQGCKDHFFDNDGDGFGLSLKQCLCGAGVKPYTALKSGDCNDENGKVNPGVTEVCDDADNNCDSQVDEKCNADGDKFCTDKMTVIGSPSACVLGGGDCDDSDGNVHPAGNEICNDKDDNCDGKVDIGCDDDGDGYCDANLGLAGSSDKQLATADFEAGVPAGWTSSSSKTSSCGSYGTILGGYNIYGAGAWAEVKLDNIGLHKSLKVEFDFIKIDSWDGESGQMLIDSKQAWAKSYIYHQGKQECGVGSNWYEQKERITAIVAHTGNSATIRFTTTLNQSANDESWGIDNVVITAIGSLPKICTKGGGDCNDSVKAINPGAVEVCGNTTDENCSGDANDDGAQGCSTFYKDLDADGYGANGNDKKCLCKADGLYVGTKAGDCDDGNNLVNEGATEVCDGLDNNCDGKIDEGCDNDGDGYCDASMSTIGKPAVCPNGGGDCNDDNDPQGVINPGATELCGNSVDENCDGSLNSNAAGNCTEYFYDGDGDGFGVNVKQCLCTPENGFTATKAGDCDDSDKVINPDATEVCGNGKDDNCNGTSNEKDAQGCSNFYKDGDADGFGAGTAQCQCSAEGAFITKTAGDCDDGDKNTHPGAAEICDGKDNSCAGTKDKGCDDDNDGYCDISMTVIKGALCLKSVPVCEGEIYNSKCYQAYPITKDHASAKTACETLGGQLVNIANQDENVVAEKARAKACGNNAALIGLNDIAAEGKHVWGDKSPLNYTNWATNQPDNSGEEDAVQMVPGGTWNDVSVNTAQCYICELGKVTIGGGDDCNDTDKNVNPGVVETCDDKDNNCDGKADEKCDDDKDGYCNKDRTVIGNPSICSKGGGDCDDSNNLIYPGKAELCDDNDNNCNGNADEGCDDDGDGFCDVKMSTLEKPKVCPGGGGDCNDTDKAINPGAKEVCDGKDNNCAAGTDEVCNDEDGDGYCKGNVPPDAGCPKGGGDCDDGNKDVNPGAKEDCLTDTDDNCNKQLNEIGAANCKNFYNDNDGDNYGAQSKCDGKELAGGFCLKGYKDTLTWADAQQACSNWGGNLASITSSAEEGEIKNLAKATCGDQDYWIGMHDKPGGLAQPVTFHNCGKTGRYGPSQGNCDGSYTGTPLAGKVKVVNGVQQFTVPVDGTYVIEAFGARGYNGGNGARMKGTFELKAGQVLEIVAGQMGSSGGGNGGGGGGTFVYTGNTLYIAAGGGGGQSPGHHGTTSNNGTNGDRGSGGSNGAAGTGTHYDGSGPGAGWNGYDTINDSSNAIGAKSRPTWVGGEAIRHGYNSDGGFGGGGFSIHPAGGGGGYSGGGAGGGGGGSYNAGTNQSNSTGANNTHGKVIITSPKANVNNEQEWVDKTEITYTNWGANQPDSVKATGVKAKVSDGKWDDQDAAIKLGCFVCKRPPSSACICYQQGTLTGLKGGDCDDTNPSVNPLAIEICDTLDNDCLNGADDGCDDDGDGFCAAGKLIGEPPSAETLVVNSTFDGGASGWTGSSTQITSCGSFGQVLGGYNVYGQGHNAIYTMSALGKHNHLRITFHWLKIDTWDGESGQLYLDGKLIWSKQYTYNDGSHTCGNGAPDQRDKIELLVPHTSTSAKLEWKSTLNQGATDEAWAIDNVSVYTSDVKALPKLVEAEVFNSDFENNSTGWSGSSTTTTSCGGFTKILGGYGVYGQGASAVRNLSGLQKHNKLRVNFTFVKVDTWDGESGEFYVDGKKVWSKSFQYNDGGSNTCGNGAPDQAVKVEISVDHTANTAKLEWKSTLNQGATDEAWGIDAVSAHIALTGGAAACPKTGTVDTATCKSGKLNDQPGYIGQVLNINTRSHGGGFHSAYNEWWYPQWSGSYIYRYNADTYQYLGNFHTGQNCMMQMWADVDGSETDFYTANWGYNTITRIKGKSSSRVWTRNIGSTSGGVATDNQYVYGMRHSGRTVWVMNKSNGSVVKTFNLNNGYVSSQHGGLAIVEGKIYYGNTNRQVDRFTLASGNFDNATFNTAPYIYNAAFDGKNYCVSQNNSSVYCYTLLKAKSGCTTGDDCDDKDKDINPGNVEICDDKDNNCDLITDDKCDADQDGYCSLEAGLPFGNCCDAHGGKGCNVTAIKDAVCKSNPDCCNKAWTKNCATAAAASGVTKCQFPSTCAKGGSDCDDKNSAVNLEAIENCTTPADDNCDGITDVLNALGCVKFYFDGDGDGAGVDSFECRCSPKGKFAALDPGDCDDSDPAITSGVIVKVLSSPQYIGNTINMNTRSHGGGYSPAHNEYWYPQWAGSTIYRYNKQYQYQGSFGSGQNSMMQLWGDKSEDNYYTANWGYNTCTKRKGKSSTQLWSYNVGSTSGGVTTDDKYAYCMRHSGSTVWVLNKSTGGLVKTMGLSGGSISYQYGGMALVEDKLWYGNGNRNVYRYNPANGQYDGGSFTTAPNIYNMAFDGERYCVSSNNSSVYCYKMTEKIVLPETCDGKDNNCNKVIDEGCDLDKDGYCGPEKVVVNNVACPNSPQGKANCTPTVANDNPQYVGYTLSMNTRSHGGGYAPKYKEFWYPQWAGGTIYRYDASNPNDHSPNYKGAFNSGQGSMMQLWGEPDGTYLTANWGYNTISRKQPYSSSTLWNRNIGSTAGAVTSDANYVYAMRYYDRTVYKLNKANGQIINTSSLSGGYVTTTYGGLVAVNKKMWRGNYNRRVDRFDLGSFQYDGKTFHTAPYIYNMAFNGKEYCVSQNNSSVYCYLMFVKGDCTMGDDCDDFDKTIFPSKDETICDEKDNNCNGVIDDGCDKDGDGYCDKVKVTFGAPAVCQSGGGDCNDDDKKINPGANEVCGNGIDDNCNTVQDEENATGCSGWYYDGDQDGFGLANNARCLCKGEGLYSTKKVGDCDDTCSACYPNAPEVCDGKNNKCGTTLLNSISHTTTLTFETRSHGGGFNPAFNEFWYPQWSGSTVYRYSNQQGNSYLGTFSSGQSSIMQLWAADDENGDYYTANWGYNTINKWKSKSNQNVWSFNIGGTAGGVTSENQFVYAMRNTGSTLWKLNRDTGKEVGKINLSGGSISDIHGSLTALTGKLYRGNTNGTVYRFNLADGKYDGVNFQTPVLKDPNSGSNYPTYIYNTSFDKNSYCISANNNNVLCYRLTQPGSEIDKDCDKDGDGWCDKNMTTIGKPPACPNGGLDCNDGAKSIYPGAPEQCNKSDDNCNGIVDEGASDTCNKEIYQAQATCDAAKGQCVILKCSDTFFDANGLISDGCECSGNDAWEPNDSCSKAVEISKNVHDGFDGTSITLMGKVVKKGADEDWYKFYAVDQKDVGSGVCDRFNVRVRFLQNPGGLGMDVHRGSCPPAKSSVCCGQTDFNWFTNFKGYNKNVYSSYHSEYGECPCNTDLNNYWSTRTGYNQRPSQGGPYCKKWSNGVCIPRGYDFTRCNDNSAWFYVRVYKLSGGPSCTPYQLEITNAVYGAPGHKGKSGF